LATNTNTTQTRTAKSKGENHGKSNRGGKEDHGKNGIHPEVQGRGPHFGCEPG